MDLFDSNLSVLTDVKLQAGQRALLYDLNAASARRPAVVAAACRVRGEQWDGKALRLSA